MDRYGRTQGRLVDWSTDARPTAMSASSKNERIEAYIEEHYTTRINVVSGQAEIAPLGSKCFVPISKFELNSLRRKIDKEIGLLTSSDNLRAIVESDFSPRINPVAEYFYRLPRLDPQNNHHIARLAATVAQLHRISTAFHAQTTEYELLVRRFEPSDKGEFRTTAEIISLLRGSTSIALREKQMGEALRKAGFPRVSKRVNKMPLYGYLVKLVEEK